MAKILDFGVTFKQVLDTINDINTNAGGTGTGFTEITNQYVNVWSLEAGIYKWTYKGQKYIQYLRLGVQTNTMIGNASNDDVYLFINNGTYTVSNTLPDGEVDFGDTGTGGVIEKTYKAFKIETGDYSSSERKVYWGWVTTDNGALYSRDIQYIPTATAVTTTATQTISGNKTFTGNVDFTNANVSGLSNGIPVLTTQTVNLADLEAGIYHWEYSEYNAEEDYYDTSKILLVGDSTCTLYSNPVFLQIHKDMNEVSFEAIDNEGYGYDETHRVIYYGGMHLEDGDGYWNRRDLDLIPEEYIDTTQFSQFIKKTKITVGELQYYMSTYSAHIGKMVQLVYKGTNSVIPYVLNTIGLLTIHNSNQINAFTSYVDASQSELSAMRYSLFIAENVAQIQYYSWTFDFTQTGIGNTTTVNITDSDFDIYIIG